jgi:hypothetical protein
MEVQAGFTDASAPLRSAIKLLGLRSPSCVARHDIIIRKQRQASLQTLYVMEQQYPRIEVLGDGPDATLQIEYSPGGDRKQWKVSFET